MTDTLALSVDLRKNGFVIIHNFLEKSDSSPEFISYINSASKFKDGLIGNIPSYFMANIQKKIFSLMHDLSYHLGIQIDPNYYGFSAIRVNKTQGKPTLRQPFNYHLDPKISPGGVLNWHIDHFSYYLERDHTNYLICYSPIQKPNANSCNLAIIPYEVLKQNDPKTYARTLHRGALRFRCVESDTKSWFEMRFPNDQIEVGQWYAIDDYYPSPGWRLSIDLEKAKIVPQLHEGDLLIMRADVIHRTENAKTDRISIRCDAIPLNSMRFNPWVRLILMILMLPFDYPKVRYNKKIWLRVEITNRLKFARLIRFLFNKLFTKEAQ